MKNYVLFMICNFCIILNFGKESARAQEIAVCDGILQFFKVGNTSGNYPEVISRAGQFVALQDGKLSIYDKNVNLIHEKKVETFGSRLSLDIFENILFTNRDRLGIYIPDNDEVIWKNSILLFDVLDDNIIFDGNNTLYVINDNKIHYVRHEDDTLSSFPSLDNFRNVTHLVKDNNVTFYFSYKGDKTSWIVNGETQKIMFQTSLIKSMIYAQDPLDNYGYLYFMNEKCILNSLKVTPNFNIFDPKLTKIMAFANCDYRFNDKYVFSFKGKAEGKETSFFFIENNIYEIGHDRICLKSKLDVTINAGAVNSNYIMLATWDGLWFAKWNTELSVTCE